MIVNTYLNNINFCITLFERDRLHLYGNWAELCRFPKSFLLQKPTNRLKKIRRGDSVSNGALTALAISMASFKYGAHLL